MSYSSSLIFCLCVLLLNEGVFGRLWKLWMSTCYFAGETSIFSSPEKGGCHFFRLRVFGESGNLRFLVINSDVPILCIRVPFFSNKSCDLGIADLPWLRVWPSWSSSNLNTGTWSQSSLFSALPLKETRATLYVTKEAVSLSHLVFSLLLITLGLLFYKARSLAIVSQFHHSNGCYLPWFFDITINQWILLTYCSIQHLWKF